MAVVLVRRERSTRALSHCREKRPYEVTARTWSSTGQEESPAWHGIGQLLGLGLPASRTVRRYISIVLNHPVYGILLW